MRWAIWTESIWVYRSYTDMSKICWDQNFDLGFCYFEIENCENFPILDWEKWSKFPNYCEIITSTIIPIRISQISMLQFAFYDELSKCHLLREKCDTSCFCSNKTFLTKFTFDRGLNSLSLEDLNQMSEFELKLKEENENIQKLFNFNGCETQLTYLKDIIKNSKNDSRYFVDLLEFYTRCRPHQPHISILHIEEYDNQSKTFLM